MLQSPAGKAKPSHPDPFTSPFARPARTARRTPTARRSHSTAEAHRLQPN
jgi:hypothetical protein